jgi:transposase
MGHIQRRVRNGRLTYRVRYRDPDGRERSRLFTRKGDAEQFLTDTEARLLSGTWIDPRRSRRRFGSWADGWWQGWAARPRRSPATSEAAESHLRLHLRPYFNTRPLGSISVLMVQRWQDTLGLADHRMRLQVPLLVGLVVDPLVPTKEPQESTTVTPTETIYHRRVQVLDRAGQTSVTEACRTFGISRTTYYRWAGRAQRSGLAALLPKGRRPPVMPTATPPEQVEAVLAEAVARPTIGARRLFDHLADPGVRLSPSGVQQLLRRHRLGRRAQRVAAVAQLTAATTAILTTAAKDGPFGFCHFAARPGDLVALDTFHVGKLKGVGPVWQLTAVDTATRYAIGALVAATSPLVRPSASWTTWLRGWSASGSSSPGC